MELGRHRVCNRCITEFYALPRRDGKGRVYFRRMCTPCRSIMTMRYANLNAERFAQCKRESMRRNHARYRATPVWYNNNKVKWFYKKLLDCGYEKDDARSEAIKLFNARHCA